MRIVIVDYGLGNLASIRNMIKKVGGSAEISAEPGVIAAADKLIIPGVGAFAKGMENLHARGLREVLDRKALKQKVPVLGICLGMQLLTRHSEEGHVDGLGWIDAQTKKFDLDTSRYKIPHMGWKEVSFTQPQHPLLKNMDAEPRFYFVHSYYVTCAHEVNRFARAHYGHDFDCGIINGNLVGLQFHPEKSHRFGMEIMRNFIQHFQ